MGRVRLADVAEVSGVSTATVSIVLSGNRERRISTPTCARVRAAAASLGYATPPPAPALRTLGIVLDDDGDAAAGAAMIEAIQTAARPFGSPTVISAHVRRQGAMRFACKTLLSRGADSLIFVSKGFQTLADLDDAPWRSAFINCVPAPGVRAPGSWSVVLPDHRHLAEGVAERLIRQGHVRLLVVSADPESPVTQEWVAGVQAEAAGWAPTVSVALVAGSPGDLPSAVAAVLAAPIETRPTAAIALESGSVSAILEAGSALDLSVPEDLLLVTRSHEPGLASVMRIATPPAALADAAVEALATASRWRAEDAGPRIVRVHRRDDAWHHPGQVAAARSA